MAVTLRPDQPVPRPRWYSHSYNRAHLYRLVAAFGYLPRPARLRLARAVGRAATRFVPAERAAIHATLARVTGAAGRALDRLTVATFGEFAACFSDLVSTNRRPVGWLASRLGRIAGAELIDTAFVSITAHVGNWELAGRLLAGRTTRTAHVVVAMEEGLALERWVRRDGDGVRFVSRSHPFVSLELIAALRRGDVVAVQGDRALGTRGDALIPFFGRPAPFPLGPFILAAAVGVPVVPAFCLLGADDRYAMTIASPITVKRGSEDDAARLWVDRLEDIVRRHPTQWFNFFDVWSPPFA